MATGGGAGAAGVAEPESDTAALLARAPLFSGLIPDELESVARVAVPRSYAEGEVVFREGDSGDTCFVVRTGEVRVTKTHSDGRVITLAQLRPTQMFGELAMFSDETRSATVETVEPTTAVALLSGDMRRILVDHPEIAAKMCAELADRLRAANERITRQSFQTVAGRVATVLLGQVEAHLPDVDGGSGLLIPMTQTEIAQLAGASRESASRFLAKLERAGVVTCGRGKVVVHDPPSLRNYIY